MLRFKDHDSSRQRGRGAQGGSNDERDLSPMDVENASFVAASCLAATGQCDAVERIGRYQPCNLA